MCLMKAVGERVSLKRKKSIDTLGGTDDVRVTVLRYICKHPNCTYSCVFEKKRWMVESIEASFDTLDS